MEVKKLRKKGDAGRPAELLVALPEKSRSVPMGAIRGFIACRFGFENGKVRSEVTATQVVRQSTQTQSQRVVPEVLAKANVDAASRLPVIP